MASAHFLKLPGLSSASILFAVLPALFTLRRLLKRPHRPSKLPKNSERVLVLGASSGIGRAIAHQYSERGAKVCVVGRREQKIAEVLEECKGLSPEGKAGLSDDTRVLGISADFANMDDMIRVRTALETGVSIPSPYHQKTITFFSNTITGIRVARCGYCHSHCRCVCSSASSGRCRC